MTHRFLAALIASALCTGAAAQIRVACLGDSITFGARIADREHDAYPALLGALLGTGYEVRGCGAGGATLLRAADRPYLSTAECARAIAWAPDVALVVLGTNDTCDTAARPNWAHEADLEDDARALVAAVRAGRPGARVLLGVPPAMFADRPGLAPERADDLRARAPRLQRVAAALRTAARAGDAELVDLRPVLRPGQTSDGVHPDPFGAEAIARRIAEAIENPPDPPLDLRAGLAARGVATSGFDFHGRPGLAFALPAADAEGRVVAPHRPARGAPWIWRARFFGHEPALDLALLDRGFHLAYCDVANLYGAPAALARQDELYGLLRGLGLGARPVLEGMSRGGLPAVNWAAAHPDQVAAVYGDNPVADFRSWPGGRHGKRSDEDWARCLAAYGLTEEEAADYDRMPVDRLEPLAAARVPLLLVLGSADEVVPPAENGERLAARHRALGGPVEVWRKPGAGHHPHGLHPVDPLLRAVLRAAGFAAMPSTRPAPSVEFRAGAGWPGGSWRSELERLRALATEHPHARLVFLGDSITQGLTGAGDRVAHPGGDRPIDAVFGARGALSLGLSGDRTEHLLWRIEHGALAALEPAVIVLQIGVNNVNAARHTGAETAAGIAAVVERLAAREPQARVLLCGPFPAGEPGEPRRQAIDEAHARIAALDDGRRVFYRDLRPLFVGDDGRPNDRMRGDRIHITPAGQEAWLRAIAPLVEELLDRR